MKKLPIASQALILAGVCTLTSPGLANGLVEGKCGIAESGTAFSRCDLLSSSGELSVLANNSSTLLLQASPSQIMRIGSLDERAEQISPGLKLGLQQTLSGLGVSKGDAVKSSNVKVIQARTGSGSIQSVIFIANRTSKNIDQFNAVLVNRDNAQANNILQLNLEDSARYLQNFERAFDRIEGLYEALMFEEADRVLDRTQIEVKNFAERFRIFNGSEEIMAVLNARIKQIQALRNLRSYDYQIAQWQAEQRYNRIQKEKAAAEERRRKQEYMLAVEYRKAAQANALKWWAIWMATRPAMINTTVNNVIINR